MKSPIPHSSRISLALFAGLFVVAALALLAQKPSAPSSPLAGTQVPASSSSTETDSLLPTIPMPPSSFEWPVPATSRILKGPMPGVPPPDPDELKALYGYYGPYYNTTNLDGRMAVIERSVYLWPGATWKASGMLRNQTRDPVRVNEMTAHLLGSRGELLATATATLPVADLRPGEPGPFVIEAPLAKEDVATVDWHIDYTSVPSGPRPLVFHKDKRKSPRRNEPLYSLLGYVHNDATTTIQNVQVVAAWLDDHDRVRYVDHLAFRPHPDSPQTLATMDLVAGADEYFIYETSKPPLASSLLAASDIALWGISK